MDIEGVNVDMNGEGEEDSNAPSEPGLLAAINKGRK